MPDSFRRRLDRLEEYCQPPVCPACFGRPHRLIWIDAATDRQISESLPESGCPACGEPVYREYLIVTDGEDDSPGEVA